MKKFCIYLIVFAVTVFLFYSCKKDNITTDSASKLDFSTDTIMFDTIFTTIGSTTRHFKIYNRNSKKLIVSSIYLANGKNTRFRLNINGVRASRLNDVEIDAKDSLYVFVEVTLDPNNANNPMEIVDSVVCISNGNMQDVKLVAFGQNIYLINGRVLHNDTTWNGEKPILVYNSMLLDSGKILIINSGTKVYFHKNSTMYVKGILKVNGTVDKPVIFRNDRLEHAYDDIPSQWNGIVIFSGSYENSINYAIIRNAVIGLQVGNIENEGGASLRLQNTVIENMSYACLFSIASGIDAFNCIFSNGGYYTASFVAGGAYGFYHCTFANYQSSGSDPGFVLSNNLIVENMFILGHLSEAIFGNCIIYGNKASEIALSNDLRVDFNYTFDHCLMKYDGSTSDVTHFKEIIKNSDPRFHSTYDVYDFHLDTLSSAINKGNAAFVNTMQDYLILDLDGNVRNGVPDIGAFERKEN